MEKSKVAHFLLAHGVEPS